MDDPAELRGGDGGTLVCGETGPMSWVTFASAYRYRLKVTDSRAIWFEHTHARRAISVFPSERDADVRRYVAPTVLDSAELADHVLQGALKRLGGQLVADEDARGSAREAFGDLAAIATAHAKVPSIRVLLAHAHRKLGELDTARDHALAAIALARNWRSLVTLASVERARGDDEAAIAAYDAAADAGPADTSALTDAAFLLQSRKRYAEAVARWTRARERDPELGFAEVNLLVCSFHATGDPQAAERLVEIARGPAKGVEWIAALADEVSPGWRANGSA